MRLDLKDSIISLVKTKFQSAKLNGSLLFSATELAVIRAGALSVRATVPCSQHIRITDRFP